MDLLKNERYRASLEEMLSEVDLSMLNGRTVLITGATGMLGSCLVDALLLWNRGQTVPCKIAAVGRNAAKASARFHEDWTDGVFSFYQQDICTPIRKFPAACDFIIHAASNADPVNMAKDPVHTMLANVVGTDNLLQYGICHGMRRFLYVSSGEVYGQPDRSMSDFTEEYCGPLDLFSPRSCYPEGKRAAEVLCQSYISQYGVDAVIVRPCHLFGPTMTESDSRAVSEFLRNAAAGQDIVMKSSGLLERSHCYVVDAVEAVLTVLCRGESGKAYNIADQRYQMTIRAFAERAAEAGGCQVVWDVPNDLEKKGYSNVRRAVLDVAQLKALRWKAIEVDGIGKTISILQELDK